MIIESVLLGGPQYATEGDADRIQQVLVAGAAPQLCELVRCERIFC